ncbi:MAG: phosphate acyltransferase PlsX, partial [Acidimicrobiales bacterium]
MKPVAVDVMGTDRGPAEIVAGARRASELGIPVLLVGRPEEMGDIGDLAVLAAGEVVGMHDDAATAVR